MVVAAALIFNLQAVRDLARDQIDLVAFLPDASGVRVGTPVRVAGVETGRVLGIDFLAAGDSAQIALNLRVGEDAAAVLRRDSEVRSVRLRGIGQPIVQIEAGSAAAPPIRSGDTLYGRPGVDPALLLERGKQLPAAIDSLLRSARRVQALARARGPDIERLQASIDATLAAASGLSRALEGGSLAGLLGPEGPLDAVARLQERLAELTAELDAAVARYSGGEDGQDGVRPALESLGERVTGLRAELDALRARMADGGGFLYRLPRDSALTVAIRGIQAQIDSLREEAASIALRMILP